MATEADGSTLSATASCADVNRSPFAMMLLLEPGLMSHISGSLARLIIRALAIAPGLGGFLANE